MSKLLFKFGQDWNEELLMKTWKTIASIATEKYGITFFEPQIEIVSANQMIHYSSMVGLPFLYDHWSFGKHYIHAHDEYHKGVRGIAYEMIINTDPAICYIMENNNMTLQALVLAHAAVGHSSFFKNNIAFKQWSKPSVILDYARFAKKFVADCEKAYGVRAVERILDAAHALQYSGIDRFERTRKQRDEKLDAMKAERAKYEALMDDELWRTLPPVKKTTRAVDEYGQHGANFPWPFPEENLLYFIEKNSPSLETWERELIRIVRTIAQYFYPQILTKLMNEGWASFWHYTLMQDLYEDGYIDEGSYLEFIQNHTAVCHQPKPRHVLSKEKQLTHTINPYALGFKMFSKLRQACENPTEQDKLELPTVAGKPWVETLKEIAGEYVDSSFVAQFLTSDIVEDFGFIDTVYDYQAGTVQVNAIQDASDLRSLRSALSNHYAFGSNYPTIEIIGCDMKGDRTLYMNHTPKEGQRLEIETMAACEKYLKRLWGSYPVAIRTIDDDGRRYTTKRAY